MLKKTAAILAAAMLLPAISAFADYDAGYKENVMKMEEGIQLNTPDENVFRLAGDDQEFILLDTADDDNSAFFVLSKQDYGNVSFGTSQKFDINDKKSIAYFLNNDFRERTYQYMTKQVLDYIDYNHVWYTEPGNPSGAGTTSYTTTCGLAVMSLTEFHQYKDKFGIMDNIDNTKTDAWWLRSARVGGDINSVFVIGLNPKLLGNQQEWSIRGGTALRPVFWLKRDFFKDNKLDLEHTGANVLKVINEKYKAEELQNEKAGYLNHEMKQMGFSVSGIDEIATIKFLDEPTYIMDSGDAGFDFEMTISGSESLEYDLIYTIADREYSEKIIVQPNTKFTKNVRFENPPKGINTATVRLLRDGKQLYSKSCEVCVIDFYKKQFMDEYSRLRMCTHFEFSYNYNDDFQIDIMKKAGVAKVRDGIEWNRVEKEKGVYNYEYIDKYMQYFRDKGIDPCIMVGYSNSRYVVLPEGVKFDSKYAPTTKDELDGYVNYILETLRRYPEIKAIEIWNESNWPYFWSPEPNALDYATMIKAVSTAVRRERSDVKIIGGSLVYHKAPFFAQWLNQNISPYIDAVSTHPYFYPGSVDTTPNVTINGDKTFNNYGGFLEWYSTEVGLPNSTNANGISAEGQADALAKYMIYSDYEHFEESFWYDFRDDGTNPANNEHNFGVLKYDYTPKPAYAVLSQTSNVLNGSLYVGTLDYGENIRAFLYLKDGKPFVALWNTKDEPESVTLENEYAEDMYGNKSNPGNTFEVDKNMHYYFEVPESCIAKAAANSAIGFYGEYLEMFEGEDAEQDRVTRAIEKLKGVSDEASADELIEENINIGLELLRKDMPLVKLSQMLNQLRYAEEALAGVYAKKNETAPASDLSAIETIYRTTEDAKGGDANIQKPYTEKILRYAKKYKQRIDEISQMENNSGKGQAIKYYEALAKTYVWAEQMEKLEAFDKNLGAVLYTSPSKSEIYQGESQEISVTVSNCNLNEIKGAVARISDDEGNVIYESDKLNIPSGGNEQVTAVIEIPDTKLTGDYEYMLELMQDDKVLTKQNLYITVKGVVNVKLLPADRSLITTKNIQVEVENTYNKPMAFRVALKAPDGWVLKKSTIQASVGINAKKVVSFPVEKSQKVPFNHYSFEVSVLNTKGEELIKKTEPLNMPIAVMNKNGVAPEDFDGNVTSWQNAYPVYIEAPEDVNDKETWQKSQLAARLYAKWDNEYFYFLCDVNDDTYIQNYEDVTLWQGDSIQVSLDTKDDKAKKYVEDDYELGMSYTDSGEQVYAYFFGTEEYGRKDDSWVKIIRDNDEKLTRYYARIPLSRLGDLVPRKGQKFGFNVAINDADFLARDNQFYLTQGTGSPQNPSYYLDWVFWNYELIKKNQSLDDVSVVLTPNDIFHK